MTKQDYILLADALRRVKPDERLDTSGFVQWAIDCGAIAEALAKDNPRFKRETFDKYLKR